MQIIISQVLTAIVLSFLTAGSKIQKGETFSIEKLLRTTIVGLVLGVGSLLLGFEITGDNFKEVLVAQTGLIAVADQLTKVIVRLIKKWGGYGN